ncbi:MAG: tetratricopeptide repeat protein [Planctomycetes bacterium]|nr:tetratricopeptide repeat protein [Planctomycetota bacterium]
MDFTKQLQKADEAQRRRNYDFAVELYQQLLEISPDLGEARAGLRQALKKRLEAKGGGSKFLRALGGAAPLALAKTLKKAGKNDAAAKQLESYLASNPLDEDGNLLLGMALEDAGHFASAQAVYEFLAEIAPKNPEGLKRAGAMTYRLGDHEKALQYYERALSADPRDQEALKARKDLAAERALSGSNSPNVQHSREQIKDKDVARELERSQRLHRSTEELREDLVQLEARYADEPTPETMIELGETHERLKDYDTALEWIERALSYKKDSFELLCKAGDLRVKVMKKAIAQAGKSQDDAQAGALERELWAFEADDYRRRVDLRPSDSNLRLQLGRRLMKIADFEGAMAELQKAMSDPRTKRDAQFGLAQCFQGKGYADLARKEYSKCLEGTPQVDDRAKEILYNLGLIAESAGQSADARGYFARIFEVDIGYRDVAEKMERYK